LIQPRRLAFLELSWAFSDPRELRELNEPVDAGLAYALVDLAS
jgi:hypothetical protein